MDSVKTDSATTCDASPLLSDEKHRHHHHHHNDGDNKCLEVDEALLTKVAIVKPSAASRRCCRCSILTFLVIFAILSVIYLVVIPFTFWSSVTIQRSFLFLNDVLPKVGDPQSYGLNNCTKWMNITSDDDIRLGAWYIPPVSECNHTWNSSKELPNNGTIPTTAKLVVLYAHGNGGSRSTGARTKLYNLLSTHLDAHVIAFDYRGYGDSSYVTPSAQGVTNDTLAVYQWILSQGIKPNRILVWGHSLGTAVSVRTASALSQSDLQVPLGTVLEAPFTSLDEEICEFPPSKLFRFLPYFNYCFRDPIVNNPELNFDSISLLPQVRTPLLILHAHHDRVVPFKLGKKLYDTAKTAQPQPAANKTQFHEFDRKYGHRNLVDAPELPQIITDFIASLQ